MGSQFLCYELYIVLLTVYLVHSVGVVLLVPHYMIKILWTPNYHTQYVRLLQTVETKLEAQFVKAQFLHNIKNEINCLNS